MFPKQRGGVAGSRAESSAPDWNRQRFPYPPGDVSVTLDASRDPGGREPMLPGGSADDKQHQE